MSRAHGLRAFKRHRSKATTPDEEREFIRLWEVGTEGAEIARQRGIPRGTVSSRAVALRKRGVNLAKRPRGGSYPQQRASARQGTVHAAVHDSAVHAAVHGAVQVQNSAEPPIPPALAAELGRLWAAIDALQQEMHRPVHEIVQSLPEPLFDDPTDNATKRWNLYLKHGLRVRIEALAQARGIAPSRVVQELLWTALTDRRASTP
jgi:hypothetical protein